MFKKNDNNEFEFKLDLLEMDFHSLLSLD